MSTHSTGGGMRTWPAGGVWFVLLGVVWIILGLVLISAPLIATLAAVWIFGLLLVIGGVLHTVHAFTVRDWPGFLLYLIEGLLVLLVGVLLLIDPVGGAIGLTLLIGFFLVL
ncbi:MAG TPA: DUF308 domain-containing protein, partial [Gemmataceae bacterium]|nr:DUF308 domain-containing protein [Gemmataceae bacterium]